MTAFLQLICALTQIHVTLSLYCADGVTECELWRDTLDNRNAMTDNGGVGSACGFSVISPCPCFGLGLSCGFFGNDCCSKMNGGSQLWLTDARSTLRYNHITFGIWLNLGSLGNGDYFKFYYSINDSLNWVEFASVNYAWTDNHFEQELPEAAWDNNGGVRIMFEMIAGGSDTAYLQTAELKGFLMTQTPTKHPTTTTSVPTLSPTQSSNAPTCVPTVTPSMEPTNEPTLEPTYIPSTTPTLRPTDRPTKDGDDAYGEANDLRTSDGGRWRGDDDVLYKDYLMQIIIIIAGLFCVLMISIMCIVRKRKQQNTNRMKTATTTKGETKSGMELTRVTSDTGNIERGPGYVVANDKAEMLQRVSIEHEENDDLYVVSSNSVPITPSTNNGDNKDNDDNESMYGANTDNNTNNNNNDHDDNESMYGGNAHAASMDSPNGSDRGLISDKGLASDTRLNVHNKLSFDTQKFIGNDQFNHLNVSRSNLSVNSNSDSKLSMDSIDNHVNTKRFVGSDMI